jgi:hypothetical protein
MQVPPDIEVWKIIPAVFCSSLLLIKPHDIKPDFRLLLFAYGDMGKKKTWEPFFHIDTIGIKPVLLPLAALFLLIMPVLLWPGISLFPPIPGSLPVIFIVVGHQSLYFTSLPFLPFQLVSEAVL